jgi:predicted DCC family thiol-disulfide oxidoreductase YuxK
MSAWQIKVLIDGACPLCRREANLWRWLDRGRGRIALEDVSVPDCDAARYGLTHEQAMEQIHGILPSGAVVHGMEVFRRAYSAVGWGWLLAPTAWPLLRPLFDRFYRWFARNRLRLAGRFARCAGRCPAPRPSASFAEYPASGAGSARPEAGSHDSPVNHRSSAQSRASCFTGPHA